MTNKNNIIIIISLLILAGFGAFFLLNRSSVTNQAEDTMVLDTVGEGSMEVVNDDLGMEVKIKDAPEGAYSYNITEGSASYVAQKRFLTKEDAVVTGTTADVTGEGWFDPETGALFLRGDVALATLVSDSEQRDKDLMGMFKAPTAVLVLDQMQSAISLNEGFTLDLPVKLVVNGIEQTVDFNITGVVTETQFTATGNATVNISDFGMNPPALLEVYTVDDAIELKFDVTGTVKN